MCKLKNLHYKKRLKSSWLCSSISIQSYIIFVGTGPRLRAPPELARFPAAALCARPISHQFTARSMGVIVNKYVELGINPDVGQNRSSIQEQRRGRTEIDAPPVVALTTSPTAVAAPGERLLGPECVRDALFCGLLGEAVKSLVKVPVSGRNLQNWFIEMFWLTFWKWKCQYVRISDFLWVF